MVTATGWRAAWISLTYCLVVTGCAQTRSMVQNPFTKSQRLNEVKFDLAQVAEREGQLRKAADQYRELLAKQPKNAQLHHRLGVVQVRLGEREEGLEHLRRANQLKPSDPALLNDLGFACLEAGELEEAEKHLREALAISPNDRRTLNNLGLCVAQSGRIDEAYMYFRRVAGDAEAHANLGYILAQSGDIPRALSHYHQALSLDPQMRSAAEALIQLSRLSGRIDNAATPIARQPSAQQSAIHQVSASDHEDMGAAVLVDEIEPSEPATPGFGLSTPASPTPYHSTSR